MIDNGTNSVSLLDVVLMRYNEATLGVTKYIYTGRFYTAHLWVSWLHILITAVKLVHFSQFGEAKNWVWAFLLQHRSYSAGDFQVSVHVCSCGFDVCAYMHATVCMCLWCFTQVFTLALGLGLQRPVCWQQLGTVSRCELSSVLFGSLAALPLAPNAAVAWPTEQRGMCISNLSM